MIRWPWVSRRAYDLAIERAERAEARVKELTDQIVRMARRARGMSEITPAGKERPASPVPSEIERHIQAYEDPLIRSEIRRAIIRRLEAGEAPGEILKALRTEVEQQ